MSQAKNIRQNIISTRWLLVLYDLIIWGVVCGGMMYLNPSGGTRLSMLEIVKWTIAGAIVLLACRFIATIYRQVWRYGYLGSYIRLIVSDMIAGIIFIILSKFVLPRLGFANTRAIMTIGITSTNMVLAVSMRLLYSIMYRRSSDRSVIGGIYRFILRAVGNIKTTESSKETISKEKDKKRLAIVGGGRTGSSLAEDLMGNPLSGYTPVCFIESNIAKVGRRLHGLPVLYENSITADDFRNMNIDEIVITVPESTQENKKRLYDIYKQFGYVVKVYDYPLGESADGKRSIRSFTIEELLARKPVTLDDERVKDYYNDKTVLVTGGGGSIGSELARQVATMNPRKLIILDIAENSTYELQQELRRKYGWDLDLSVEIITICDKPALGKVFDTYNPDIVIHAAAHKHVPLMEHNSAECIKNNVYGTRNVMEVASEHATPHFIMVSTDKAVNPTNVMGATKRICELVMHVMARKPGNKTVFSATRFGNVLGSAGSVVPLFRKQINEGGPVTVTHRDITRYFMTIPEASQLVLTSGAMAKNGELFVLDMGDPVRIYDLAENMIKLSGFTPGVDMHIVETGLRPGEKLYEELLISGMEQGRTDNELIFIEKDEPLSEEELERRLALLEKPVRELDDEAIKKVMPEVVPTYKRSNPAPIKNPIGGGTAQNKEKQEENNNIEV